MLFAYAGIGSCSRLGNHIGSGTILKDREGVYFFFLEVDQKKRNLEVEA